MLELDRHPSSDAVVAYVTGDLVGSAARGLERHVARCSACALRLREEACLEVALHDVAEISSPPMTPARRRRLANVTMHGMGALAAAASVLLTLGLSSPWVRVDTAESVHDVGRGSSPSYTELAASTDGDLLSCVPTTDDTSCDDPPLVAQLDNDGTKRVPWTELPESIDPATCWSEEDGAELVCSGDARSG